MLSKDEIIAVIKRAKWFDLYTWGKVNDEGETLL